MLRRLGMAMVALTVLAGPAVAGGAPESPNRSRLPSVEFLAGLPREWAGTSAQDCRTYERKNIERLVPRFAEAAAKFLDAFVAIHGHVTITSAHRTAQEQACVCVGEKGPCAGKRRVVKTKKGRRLVRSKKPSRHQLGIALDVRAGTGSDAEFQCMHEFADLNPQFGVRFPLGKRDRPHMEPSAWRAELRLAGLGSSMPTVTPCLSMRRMLTHEHVD